MELDKARQVLKQYFGYEVFRPMQGEIIQSIFNKNDTLVLMPTGGGKSICYQVPAIVMEGVCVVISPLIALMKDQVEGLKANGVPAAFLNSTLSAGEQQTIENLTIKGAIKLLYVSPEKLVSPSFLQFLGQFPISLFAIDEAHCISTWGHDFRPEYSQLKILKDQFPKVPLIALTATADKLTRKDIVTQLHFHSPKIFIASFNRPNLSLTVLPGQNRLKTILTFIKNKPNQSGIIYCLSRKTTEGVAQKIRENGIDAAHYHAGLSGTERSRIQDRFINDSVPIICATIAFGMGIDKSNVRWVIHYNLPKNIESYYQEIGRAGRDGLKSDTLLFYSYADVFMLRGFIEDAEYVNEQRNAQKQVQLAKLERMQQYADALLCRRKILLNYFSENLEDNCNNCDVCKNPPAFFDGTTIAQKALSAIARLKEKVATGTLIDVLRGASKKEIFQSGYHQIKTYGTGNDISYRDWQQYLLQMLNLGLIEIAYDQANTLKLTPGSKGVLFEHKKVNLVQLADIKKKIEERIRKPKSKRQQLNEELFERLRKLRKDIAATEHIPPYLVFTDATLHEMVAEKPTTENEMRQIPGLGQRKLQLYGELFINEIIGFIQQQIKEGNKVKGSTYIATYEYYKKGMAVEEIAKQRQLNPTTIYSHLAHLYEKGNNIDILQYISKEELRKIMHAIDIIGITDKLKELYEYLNEETDYYKIRLGIAYYRKSLLVNR